MSTEIGSRLMTCLIKLGSISRKRERSGELEMLQRCAQRTAIPFSTLPDSI
jgi:hypothetical protein